MRLIYIPIADSFFESSIMQEELAVRFVMLALIRLALRAGADGVVDMDPRVFAASINIPLADVERALVRLMEADPYSGCPDEDGRRVVPVDLARPARGWRLVNWKKYRHIVALANDAARKRAKRKRKDDMDKPDTSENVPERPDMARNVGTNTKNEERKTKNKKERGASRPLSGFPPSVEEVRKEIAAKGYTFTAERFVSKNEEKDWKGIRNWRATAKAWQTIEKKQPTPTGQPCPAIGSLADLQKPHSHGLDVMDPDPAIAAAARAECSACQREAAELGRRS